MGTTAAYFSDCDQTVNILEPGHNTTDIEENFPSPSPRPPDENPEYSKTVWVSNGSSGETEHAVSCYVRLSLSYSHGDIAKAVNFLNFNTTDWIYNKKDGFYYYRHRLEKGEKTKPLFTGFRIDSNKISEKYKEQLSYFSIHVYEESVQAQGFSDYNSAWEYYLKPIKKS